MADDLTTRAVTSAPTSIDPAARTATFTVISASNDAPRADAAGPYIERLDLRAIDPKTLLNIPLLDTHKLGSIDAVLGTVVDAGIDGRGLWATVKFSSRAEGVWADVQAGMLRSVSAGYQITGRQVGTTPAGKRLVTVTGLTVWEISLVPIVVDSHATVRGLTMDTTTTAALADTTAQTTETQTSEATRSADAGTITNRAAVNQEIRSIGRLAGMDQPAIDALVDRAATVDEARAAGFAAMATRSAQTPNVAAVQIGVSYDDPEIRTRSMAEALHHRLDPSVQLQGMARQFAEFSLSDHAREILRTRGLSTTGLSPSSLITRALNTTSDFAILTGSTINRILRQSYTAAPARLKALGRQTSARDFRSLIKVQLGEFGALPELGESGEIKSQTLAEAKESYRVRTFASKMGVSTQLLVNDDLSAFSSIATKFAQASVATEAGVLVSLLSANGGAGVSMDDGNPLFHTSHANIAGNGAAISDTSLGAARLAMRKQTGLGGNLISVTPKNLVVPAALETAAEKYLATLYPAQAANVNPFNGKLTLIVEPRLDAVSATRWYVTADPAEIEGLEYAYLDGNTGPTIETKSGWDVDGVEVRCILRFGAGFVESRAGTRTRAPDHGRSCRPDRLSGVAAQVLGQRHPHGDRRGRNPHISLCR